MSESRQRQGTGGSTRSKSAALDPLIGRVINGRFKVVSVIARGGMGKVYKAEQAPLGRICALKVLSPKYDGDHDPEFHRRFFLEASTAAKLSHPNTVTVFDYGHSDDDIYFIAMEYIEGKTLHRVLREEGPLPEERASHIARQICRSLREAHGLGVVHRDLKPGNVLLVDREDEHDHVKVLDFGLVKDMESGEELTQQGLFMGSPKYMAPEQVTSGEVSARTDVYALGVMLYEMLSGRVPFDKGPGVGTLMSHVHDPVPPLLLQRPDASISQAMSAVVHRCLEKDPAQRYSSMNELLAALKNLDGAARLSITSESLPAIAGPQTYRSSIPSFTITGDFSGTSAPSSAPPNSSAITCTAPLAADTGLKAPPAAPVFVAPPITDSMGPRPGPPAEQPSAAAARGTGARTVPWVFAAIVATGVGVGAIALSRPPPAPPIAQASAAPSEPREGDARRDEPAPAAAAFPPRTLQIESAPPGAAVREGNKELCAQTPCEVTWRGQAAAPTSEHELVFEMKGFKPATVRVSADEEKVRARLDPAFVPPLASSARPKANVFKPDYKPDPYESNLR